MIDEAVVSARTEALLKQMTLEEKVAQMVQVPYAMVGREEALRWAKLGAGSFLHVLGDDAREIQKTAMETRLGIPVLFGIDAIHGHGLNDHATIFPSQLAAACSWDAEKVEEMGRVTAREVATDGLHWTFSPVLCLGRDPRWGRVDETFGEDPFLTGEMGAAIIRGYQGKSLDDDESILACAKHYIGYGEAVGGRDACDTEMTWRKLREVFLPPFSKAVEAGCATFMTAYGSIDSTPFTASRKALHDILRDELGFDGFVVTDWDNCRALVTGQHVCATLEEAAEKSAAAGNDMIMTTLGFYDAAIRAVREGRLDEQLLDEAVRHILTVKVRMGLLDHPEKKGKPGCLSCPEHLDAAKRLARESVVLLRNGGVLPFQAGIKKLAVLGPNADDVRAQYGDWTYFSHPMPNPAHPAIRPYVTLLEGIQAEAAERGVEVVYAKGCGVLPSDADDVAGAMAAAKGADAVVLVLGDCIDQTGEGKDRADLALSGRQMELYRAARALGVPLVTVLVSSKPLACTEAAEGSDAFLAAFNGGMFAGTAVAEVLFGRTVPSGRLPISFPHHSGQTPVYYNALPGWHGGAKYCDLPQTPLFAFGEGLSYTTFAYEGFAFDPSTMQAKIAVRNAGDVAADEVVQLYFRDVVSSVITPVKQLMAFRRVTLAAGESRVVVFELKKQDFSLVRPDETRVTEPGVFELMCGHSSRDEDLLKMEVALD